MAFTYELACQGCLCGTTWSPVGYFNQIKLVFKLARPPLGRYSCPPQWIGTRHAWSTAGPQTIWGVLREGFWTKKILPPIKTMQGTYQSPMSLLRGFRFREHLASPLIEQGGNQWQVLGVRKKIIHPHIWAILVLSFYAWGYWFLKFIFMAWLPRRMWLLKRNFWSKEHVFLKSQSIRWRGGVRHVRFEGWGLRFTIQRIN